MMSTCQCLTDACKPRQMKFDYNPKQNIYKQYENLQQVFSNQLLLTIESANDQSNIQEELSICRLDCLYHDRYEHS